MRVLLLDESSEQQPERGAECACEEDVDRTGAHGEDSLQGDGFEGKTGLQVLRVRVESMACPIGRRATEMQHGVLNGTNEGLSVDDELIAATEDDELAHVGALGSELR